MNFDKFSFVIGIDVHKYSHTAMALDFFGQEKANYSFTNETISQFLVWLSGLADRSGIVVGIEDINGYGYHLAQALVSSGWTTRYVPPVLTDRDRRHAAHWIKTDQEDARRVAKVILKDFEKTLPAKEIVLQSSTVRELDLLVQERQSLVRQQTELKNQLHSLLHPHYGDTYRQEFKSCFSLQAITWYQANLERVLLPLPMSICRRFSRLSLIQSQIKQIRSQTKLLADNHSGVKSLTIHLPGCGLDSAALIVAEIGTISRFATRAKLARYAGLAPVAHSSGRRQRLYTDRGGNRRLNRAIHQVALSQIARWGLEQAKAYYSRKQGEGKSKLWSLRCLKRHICDHVFTILKTAL